ncbi:MAG TPA: phosphoribosylaminoimidazolesuccinocarboxamide synthase [Anaerolineae bacterium]|nr:phosphoribosylaminoimidazolesuccinocarboxamide synthase [Anaerolineae bacterium]
MLTQSELNNALAHTVESTNVTGWDEKIEGKVRDIYTDGEQRLLVTTDRISAFDRILGTIPYKGQVLNQLTAWWFSQTRDLVSNHVLDYPDPNATLARTAVPLPVEVVVRGYITGVTKTSIWYLYEQGDHAPYGIPLPAGLRKYEQLPTPIITPTTKAEKGGHDERLTHAEIVDNGILPADLWQQVQDVALKLFARGQEKAAEAGLILVDTKYEFGLVDGLLTLIDEIHTPDSSRFWIAATYQENFDAGQSPENFDKEFLRKWYAAQGYRGDGTPPTMPDDFRVQVAERYITAYEKLTGQTFVPGEQPATERINRTLSITHH